MTKNEAVRMLVEEFRGIDVVKELKDRGITMEDIIERFGKLKQAQEAIKQEEEALKQLEELEPLKQ